MLSGGIFIGIEMRRTKDDIFLTQHRYATDVLGRFNMWGAKGAVSPLADAKTLVDVWYEPRTTALYREAIGCLLCIANCTRPDILFAVNIMARFNRAPTEAHFSIVKHIMRYIKQTLSHGIRFTRHRKQVEFL